MSNYKFIIINNQETFSIREIPVLSYDKYFEVADELLQRPGHHCVTCYAYPHQQTLKFICVIADDVAHHLKAFSYEMSQNGSKELPSLTAIHPPMHINEREITENLGVKFVGHPWAKPVRYSWNRADRSNIINEYPFYRIDGGELQ